MKNTKQILYWALAGVGLLLIAVVVTARLLLTPERIQQSLVPLLEEVLEREVSIGAIDIGLLSGITAEELVIRDPQGGVLLATRKAVLKYQFWPLLWKKIVIDQMRFESPELNLVRQADGSFNTFATRIDAAETETTPEPAAVPGAEPAELDLLISEITISNGTLTFIDQKLNPQAPFRYQINDLNLAASKLSLDADFPLEISGTFENSPFRLRGNVDLQASSGSFKVNVEQLNLAPLTPYFRTALPGIFSRAELNLALDVAAAKDMVAVNGDLSFSGIYLVLDAIKELPIRDGELAIKLDLQADLAQSRLTLRPSRVRYQQIPLQLQGEILHWDQTAYLDLAIAFDKLRIRDAVASLPGELTSWTNGLDPAGILSLQAKLQGGMDEPPIDWISQATVELDAVQVNLGHLRPSLTGPVTLVDQSLQATGLRLAVGDTLATLDIRMPDIAARPLRLETTLQTELLNLDALHKADTDTAPAGETADATAVPVEKQPVDEPGPYDLPLDAEGTVRIGKLLYRGLTSEQLDLHYRLQKNILTIDRLTGRLEGGSFNQTGRLDLGKKGLDYQTDLKLDQIQAAPLLAACAPGLQGVVPGQLNFTSQLRGQGVSWETLKDRLVASGTAELSGLKLVNAPLVSGLAEFLRLEALKSIEFDQSTATFQIKRGNLEVDSAFNSPQVRITPHGVVGLGGRLDLSLPTALAPDLASKLGADHIKLFLNPQGWTELPIRLKGTLGAPEFKLDSKQVRDKAVDKLEEKIIRKLTPKQPEGAPVDPGKKLLEDAVKGLLGR